MSVELASLLVDIDHRPVGEGIKALDGLTAASGRSEGATAKLRAASNALAAETRRAAGESSKAASAAHEMASAILAAEAAERQAIRTSQTLAAETRRVSMSFEDMYDHHANDFATQYARSLDVVTSGHSKAAAGAKLMGHEMLNLSRQFSDVGVTAAMGMNPLMILIQQGPQMAETFSAASARGITFTGVLRQVAGAAWAAVAPLAPFVIAAGAAAAVMGGGLLLATHEVNKANKDLANSLGLTEEQLTKVEHRGITAGDVLKGTFLAAGGALKEAFAPQLDWLQDAFSKSYQFVLDATVGALKGIVGGFAGGFEMIKATWSNLPAVLGDAVISGANVVLAAVSGMTNGAIDLLNKLVTAANDLAGKAGLSITLPTFNPVATAKLANQFSGAMADVGAAGASGFARGSASVDAALGAIERSILKVTEARIRAEAGKAADGRKGGAAKQAKDEIDDLTRAMLVFNKAAEERNRLAEQFKKFDSKTVADPIAVADAAGKIAGAEELARYADLLDQTAAHTRSAAQEMADAFGGVGAAIGQLAIVLTDYDARQADIAARRGAEQARYKAVLADQKSTGADVAKAGLQWTHAQTLAARESANAQIGHYGDMLGAAKGFFDEKSKGYQIMQRAETAFRILEFAMSVQSIAAKGAETAAKVGFNAVQTASGIAAGAANIFAMLGPFAFPVVAAMVAVMAGLGARSSGGGGAASGATDMADRQAAQGAGSVLGDAAAKSASLTKAMEHASRLQNQDLEYSNQMVKSLRSIDGAMGVLAAAISRTLSAGGALSTDELGLGTTGRPATLGNLGFGNTTTKTLQDQGLSFGSQSLSDILSGGINGETFQQTLSTTIKKAFGITYSNKSSTTTTTAALDADLSRQITDVIRSLKAGVLSAAGVLGATGAEAVLDAFTVNLGKMSFKDMSGTEIQEALNAIFGKLGDDLAAAAIPELVALQKVGEGAFETLARVARQYQVVDLSLAAVGMSFAGVGIASLGARERLVDLAGGIDAFAEQTGFFAENFLSEAERLAPLQKAVTAEMARLGLAGVTTKDQFKDIVRGLDVSTEAGAALYASLMAVAPAFLKVADAATEAADAAREAANDNLSRAQSALSTARDREARELQASIDKLKGFADGLRTFRNGLGGASLADAKATFDRLAGLSASDPERLAGLQGAGQDYLNAARSNARTLQEYQRAEALVRSVATASIDAADVQVDLAEAQLEALNTQVDTLLDINSSVLSVRDAILALQAASAAVTAAGSGSFNGAGYFAANPDVAAAFAQYKAGVGPWEAAMGSGLDATGFGKKHYELAGKMEGRVGFATGGAFRVGGSGGADSQNFGPIRLSPGEVGNITREDVMRELLREIAALRAIVATMQQDNAPLIRNVARLESILTSITEGGRVMLTEDAA